MEDPKAAKVKRRKQDRRERSASRGEASDFADQNENSETKEVDDRPENRSMSGENGPGTSVIDDPAGNQGNVNPAGSEGNGAGSANANPEALHIGIPFYLGEIEEINPRYDTREKRVSNQFTPRVQYQLQEEDARYFPREDLQASWNDSQELWAASYERTLVQNENIAMSYMLELIYDSLSAHLKVEAYDHVITQCIKQLGHIMGSEAAIRFQWRRS